MEFLAKTEPIMIASRRVQSPPSHSGSKKPGNIRESHLNLFQLGTQENFACLFGPKISKKCMLDNPDIGSCFSTFEECSGLEESFSDGLKKVEVEALVIVDIISDSGQ